MTNNTNINQPSASSDDELIDRAKQGDKDAFGQLYERYLTPIYNFIIYRVGNQQEAEDLTEIVFVKAWQALDRYQLQGVPFLAWLYRIARNLVTDYHRAHKTPHLNLDTQITLPDPLPNPEEQVLASIQFEQLLEKIATLEPLYQDVLTLRFIQGLSHDEVADILDRNRGAVRVLQHRALQTLRRLIK